MHACLQCNIISPVENCSSTRGRSKEACSPFNGGSVQTQNTTKLSSMSLASWDRVKKNIRKKNRQPALKEQRLHKISDIKTIKVIFDKPLLYNSNLFILTRGTFIKIIASHHVCKHKKIFDSGNKNILSLL